MLNEVKGMPSIFLKSIMYSEVKEVTTQNDNILK